MAQRIKFFDYAKGVLIFCVVWGHFCSYLSGTDYESNLFTLYIRLFQMPLFILISGFFAKDIYTCDELKIKYRKDFYHIGIPLLTWAFSAFCLYSLVFWTFNIPTKPWISFINAYWFFPCLLCCSFLWHFISILYNKNTYLGGLIIALSVIAILIIPSYFYFSFLWIFYLLGVLIRKKYALISGAGWSKNHYVKILRILVYVFVLFLGVNFETEHTFYNTTNYLLGLESHAIPEKFFFVFIRYLTYTIVSFAALDLMWQSMKFINKFEMKAAERIMEVGKNTLFIYGFHIWILFWGINPILKNLTENKGILQNYDILRYYYVSTIFSLTIIFLSMFISKHLKRSKALSFLFMGEHKSK